jgi:hypothetical protein
MKWLFTINQTSRQAFSWCQKATIAQQGNTVVAVSAFRSALSIFPFAQKKPISLIDARKPP